MKITANSTTSAKKTHWTSLKSDVDELDIDKLKDIPSDLSNLKSKVDKLDADTD